MSAAVIGLALNFLIQIAVIVRVLLRPHRDPSSRIAWMVVVLSLPVAGIVAYFLLGETNIGRRRIARMREVLSALEHDCAGTGDVRTCPIIEALSDGTNFADAETNTKKKPS